MNFLFSKQPSLTLTALSHTSDPNSFAYPTARTRWPKILSQIIDEIEATIKNNDQLSTEDVEAGKKVQEQFQILKQDMASNAILQPLPDDGEADIKDYNQELSELTENTWLSVPWLFAECYLYRLMYTFFSTSTPFWQKFDEFVTDKRKALVGSEKGAIELVKRFRGMLQAIAENEFTDEATEKAIFEEMIQISLWGNATDLSLLTSLSVEELQSRQGKAARESSKANVLVDDSAQVWDLLRKNKSTKSTGEIHIVLDNAGFELLADLVLAGYLLESGHATKIVLHGKRMPWFVSDVNPPDLTDLVDGFAAGTAYDNLDPSDKTELQEAGKYWQRLMQAGRMEFHAEPFWTTAHAYGRMAVVDSTLFLRLAQADLVIYKGDLNYRKLTYDGIWDKTTTFMEAIGPLATKQLESKGTRTLALRTCKADVGVGLKQGQEEGLPKDWTRTGKYALVSYFDAKS